jgi:hypothetical protein
MPEELRQQIIKLLEAYDIKYKDYTEHIGVRFTIGSGLLQDLIDSGVKTIMPCMGKSGEPYIAICY